MQLFFVIFVIILACLELMYFALKKLDIQVNPLVFSLSWLVLAAFAVIVATWVVLLP